MAAQAPRRGRLRRGGGEQRDRGECAGRATSPWPELPGAGLPPGALASGAGSGAVPAQIASSFASPAMPAPRAPVRGRHLGDGRFGSRALARQPRLQAEQGVVSAFEQGPRARGSGAQRGNRARGRRGRCASPPGSGRRRAGARAVRRSRRPASPSQKAESSGRSSVQRPPLSLRESKARNRSRPSARQRFTLGPAVSGQLADLHIGVALGEQGQGAQLGRLQRPQRLAAAGDLLAPLGPFGRPVPMEAGSARPSRRSPPPDPRTAGEPSWRSRLRRIASASCLVTVCIQRISSRASPGGALGAGSPARAGRRPRHRPRRSRSAAPSAAAPRSCLATISTATRLRAALAPRRLAAPFTPAVLSFHRSRPCCKSLTLLSGNASLSSGNLDSDWGRKRGNCKE